jgi:hypothetical protein
MGRLGMGSRCSEVAPVAGLAGRTAGTTPSCCSASGTGKPAAQRQPSTLSQQLLQVESNQMCELAAAPPTVHVH